MKSLTKMRAGRADAGKVYLVYFAALRRFVNCTCVLNDE